MSLKDLVKHAPAQREAIDRLFADPFHPLRIPGPSIPDWSGFRESLWGLGLEPLQEELVERDDDPVEDIRTVPGSLPPTYSVVTPPETLPKPWKLYSQRILVLSEYNEIEWAVLEANEERKDVFLVTGQPGIGSPPSPRHSQNLILG